MLHLKQTMKGKDFLKLLDVSAEEIQELVDLAAERERVAKELEKARNGLRITEGKLSNEKFVAHAPENVVNAEREKVAKYRELIAKLEASAKSLEGQESI